MAGDRSGWSRRGDDVDTVQVGARDAASAVVIDGRYRIEEPLGAGGMGQVHRARDLELGETVAIKLLRGDLDPALVDLVRREVRLARRVTHENVVRVHDLGVSRDGTPYLTMECVDGTSLRQRLAAGRPDRDEAIRIARDLCEGLDAAHRAGVIHSDLKPGNVLLRRGRPARALLSDFGIARALGEQPDHRVAGTPPYMAPEQWAGEAVGVWTDVYALALVVFELIAGQRLLDGSGPASAAPSGIDERVRAELPPRLAAVVLEALDPEPARRPPTVRPIARALAELAGEPVEQGGVSIARGSAADTPRIAVVPFRVLGPAADDYLGIGLAEELGRVLAGNRGLALVSGAGADPGGDVRAAGRALGATAVVHGSVQRAGERVRVAVELVEVDSGDRLWGERFDGTLADVFAFQETMALRICESLRVGWLALLELRPAPEEAIDLYIRARRQARAHALLGPDGAVRLLDRCLALAPRFEPAVALRAISCARAWFIPSAAAERDWGAEARAAAAAALAQAPGLAESHLASAIVAAQDGAYRDSVRALDRALALAPTSADAHNYLARLQAEAGRPDDGLARLELAVSLDPSIQDAGIYLARHHALRGDRAPAEALWRRQGFARLPGLQMLLRVALWFGDRDGVRRCIEEAAAVAALPRDGAVLAQFGRYALGEVAPAEIEASFVRLNERLSARVRSNHHQVMVEGHAWRGERELALAHLSAAAGDALIDLEWMTRCPLLEPLRGESDYRAALEQVRRRAEAIWAA
ncbi:MAG TPA: protein kinase [Kofleriaceae bacterium]|nr:protein kinase [Kofleriaceae bacterium]